MHEITAHHRRRAGRRAAAARRPLAQDKVTFGTNWLAQAEHGGFYQAVADGTYAKYGLDVTIVQGGPQVADRALLVAGPDRVLHGRRDQRDRRASRKASRRITLAAIFQKDPQVLIVASRAGFDDVRRPRQGQQDTSSRPKASRPTSRG